MSQKNQKFELKAVSLIAVLLFAFQTQTWANDIWLTYKGSMERTGELQKAAAATPLKVVWSYKVEDKSNGFVDWGPVAANGKIYTPDGLNNILVLDANDGKLIWKKKLVSNVFTVSLSADAKILYVTTAITTKASPTLFALDSESGDVLWDNMINDQPAIGGLEGAPVIDAKNIYIAYLQYEGHGGMAAYEAKTGKLMWHNPIKRFSPYSPIAYGSGRLYVGFENKSIYCFDAANGGVLWQTVQLSDLPYSSPVVIKDKVYAGAGKVMYAFDAAKGSILWQKDMDVELSHTSPAYHDGILYGAGRDGKFFAIQAAAGSLLWLQELKLGPIESSPLIDLKSKSIYIASQDNRVAVLDLKNGTVKSEIKLSEDPRGVWKGTPAFYKGRLYVGSLDRNFYALE